MVNKYKNSSNYRANMDIFIKCKFYLKAPKYSKFGNTKSIHEKSSISRWILPNILCAFTQRLDKIDPHPNLFYEAITKFIFRSVKNKTIKLKANIPPW